MSLLQRLRARARRAARPRGFASFDGLTSLLGVAALGVATLSGVFFAPTAVPSDEAAFLQGGTIYFETSDTFKKADYPGLRAVRVKVVGGGGGGGGAGATGSNEVARGDGGGGGGYAESLLLVSELEDTETVTVGAGGDGGVGESFGSDGNNSSFGDDVIGIGGNGGLESLGPGPLVFIADGVSGGVGNTGDFTVRGGNGKGRGAFIPTTSGPLRGTGGAGGGSFLSGDGGLAASSSGTGKAGNPGGQYGGGGGGATNSSGQPARNGGDGADGIVIVELLY